MYGILYDGIYRYGMYRTSTPHSKDVRMRDDE